MTTRKAVAAFCAVLLLATGSAASAHQTRTIKRDLGGTIHKYISAYETEAKRGTRYVIDGPCASACTVILGIIPKERVCVTERAMLGFHSGYIWTLIWRVHSRSATEQMWSYYPPEVQAELIAIHFWNGGLGQKHLDMMWIKASRFYPICGEPRPGLTPSTSKD